MLLYLLACNDQTLNVNKENSPPTVEILSPVPNATFVDGVDVVTVCGQGLDDEDGVLLPSWELDGAPVAFVSTDACGDTEGGGVLPPLDPGVYTLTAIAEDSAGDVAIDELQFTVVGNAAPTVEFETPLAGDVWIVGQLGDLVAWADDDTSPPTSASFASDVDGALGSSPVESDGSTSLEVSFSTPGPRVLTVSVVDADGQVGEDTVDILVCSDTDVDGIGDCEDVEECDGLDNNGDGGVDEGYGDGDGDGTADCVDAEECDGLDNDGDGLVDQGFDDTDGDDVADCVDTEECDGVDNDGDGAADEDYADTDGDGAADCVDFEDCDGVDNDGDGVADEDFTDTDGDGTADCVEVEDCDGVDNDGDGDIDEGYADSDADGIADCVDGPSGTDNCASLGGTSVLTNPDFETGSTSPFTSSGVPSIITTDVHGGTYAAELTGNYYIQQTFAAVPVSSLLAASFWTWHDAADYPAQYIEWAYSDGTTGYTLPGSLSGWVEVDLLPLLSPAKSLTRITVWGYSGGAGLPDITRFDDFLFCY